MTLDWNGFALQALKLFMAGILGAILGLERETHGRYAGIRTNIIVCIGSCLLMMLSLEMEAIFRHLSMQSAVRVDPGRLASYAIAGMGFIGAGVIVKGRGSVRGVTTAATLYTLTGIGMAVGGGFFLPAVAATLMCFIALHGLRRLPLVKDDYSSLILSFADMSRSKELVTGILYHYPRIQIQAISYNFDLEQRVVTYHFYLRNPSNTPVCEIIDQLNKLPKLKSVSWQRAEVP